MAAAPSLEAFDAYFRRADLDRDGRITGAEAIPFFQGFSLPQSVLAQIWMYADQHKLGFLGRQEFHNALRLVTVAQSGRELTPDIVKAALFSPAAARIPAPKINPVASAAPQVNPAAAAAPQIHPAAATAAPQIHPAAAAAPQLNSVTATTSQSNTMMPPLSQVGGPTASQNLGFRTPQAPFNAGANHFSRPPQATPAASVSMQGMSQGLPGGSSLAGPQLPSPNTSSLSTDWLGSKTNVSSTGITAQLPVRGPTPANQDAFRPVHWANAPGMAPRPQTPSVPVSSVPLGQASLHPNTTDSKALVLSGNGFSSSSSFGGDMFPATATRQDASKSTSSGSSIPNFSGIAPSTGSQNTIQPSQPAPLQGNSRFSPTGSLPQGAQSSVKQNQLDLTQSTSSLTVPSISGGPSSSASSQSQHPWPKMTQSNIQKYISVFMAVDKDRDGKITGVEARDLFLSWRIPREALKQIWDLSDQDNDSMLSLREFCTALYLMERFREGRQLPDILPNSVKFDETMILATNQPSAAYSGQAWQSRPGSQQQVIPGLQQAMPHSRMKPPMPAPLPFKTDSVQPAQQKSKVPVLEKHLVNQLSKEEQSGLSSKFQEASDADKKVQELEKEILDSKEKIEFYRTKMQEIVLYKSKCDSRLNEIMERTSADKREVESLARKYEAKYKDSGDVASKLTLDQATFRDIQEKKLELFNAIVKMQKGEDPDESLQVRADQIKSELDELVKSLNERCKQYGLRTKPTTLVELPFGWQPGIQEAAADWDQDWDKLEEDGFTIIKELTIEVENVVAPERPKPSSVESEKTVKEKEPSVASSSNVDSNTDASSSTVDSKTHQASSTSEQVESETTAYREDESAKSHPASPDRRASQSSSQDFSSTQLEIHDVSPRSTHNVSPRATHDVSPRATHDVSPRATHDVSPRATHGVSPRATHDVSPRATHDVSPRATHDASPRATHDASPRAIHDVSPRAMHDVSPRATESHSDYGGAESTVSREKYADEPAWGATFDSNDDDDDSIWGFSTRNGKDNDQERRDENFFFGSGDFGLDPIRTGSPSAASAFGKDKKGPFFDSVPSTPLFNSDSPMFNERPEDRAFDSFSRFDSFSMNDGVFPQHDNFSRFDSMGGAKLSRFDSISSTTDHTRGFPSFDDSDPFGSSEPFKSSESHTPKKGTDSWSAF